jgi:hypothetical protein
LRATLAQAASGPGGIPLPHADMHQLIAANYTFLCHPNYSFGDQLPNNKLRLSVNADGVRRCNFFFPDATLAVHLAR